MKLMVQIICAIALLVLLVNGQRPNCWRYYQEDPETIDQVYFPHEKNCQYFYQCTAHGAMRMKCPPGMHFDKENHQCGRPDDVVC
ncbi:peritrophin-1-like [Chironomus tepperi]|uniref:peritrophin-1-like n=1 Tax=Chironomus tepperi TaxID=113505 RepID=UPI00391F6959